MKIAFIVPYVPNQVRTRPYNLVIQLTRLGHEVDVFTVGSDDADLADVQSLKSICNQVFYYEQPVWRSLLNSLIAVPSNKPLQAVYSLQYELLHRLQEIFSHTNSRPFKYDIVHVEHLRGSEYGSFLKSIAPDVPVVWDSVDCISHLFRQAANQSSSLFGKFVSRIELGRTEKAEGRLLTIYDHVLVTSGVDREALLKTVRNGKRPASISILSNGVDQDYFQPNDAISPDQDTLIFSGKMSYHANISMVKYLVNEIMPLVWEQRPQVRLVIAGKDPASDIRKMAENRLIEVTGTVEDIRPYLWKSTMAVAPLVYGAGVQNKILESLAVGLPVITTSRALISLDLVPGRNILVGDTAEEFTEKILFLLENPSARCKLGEAGRAYVQENHDWKSISRELARIYGHLVRQTTPAFSPAKSR
jgi:glycosyltransferase involved in cell wall biosynthesis